MPSRIGCDVVVVGGGSSGCVVAGRLAAETDASVVLVEAGPDYGARSSGRWPADLLDGGALVTSHDWGYGSGELPGTRADHVPTGTRDRRLLVPQRLRRRRRLPGRLRRLGGGDRRRPLGGRLRSVPRSHERSPASPCAPTREDEVGPFHRACLDAAAAARPAAGGRSRRPRRRHRLRDRARQHRRGESGSTQRSPTSIRLGRGRT